MVFAPRSFRVDPPRRRRRLKGPTFWAAAGLLVAAAASMAFLAARSIWPPPRRALPSLFDQQTALGPAIRANGSGSATGNESGASSGGRTSPLAGRGENISAPIAPRRLGEAGPTTKPSAGGATSGSSTATASRAPVVKWDAADRQIGATVAVEGKVIDAHDTGKVCFLNFTRETRGTFYVVIFREANAGWPQPPQTWFLNKTVRVTGRVTTYEGRPQIRVKAANQIEIVKK
ncbi:MAG: OB-fold nucleic acid binding domain-containing protein [Planctomycetota bacterium]|nr:OB-fold nucleic acid binding domain-containing protein [Planctomycetota bacterium]